MKSHLPKEFEFSHWFSFYLHDQMLESLKSAEKAKVFSAKVKLKDKSHASQIEGLSGERFITWLENNGYKAEVYTMYFKQLCAALVADFLHFIYESLQCSRKGKLTVAYALLRKPLKENLFYMEWLLARPGEFLSRFETKDTKRFNLPHPNETSESEHIKIIREAIKKTPSKEWFSAELIHEFRFKKNSPMSLEPTWQKANHLFTSFKHLETEECNLNFIFSNQDSHYSQWNAYYTFVPVLLFHSLQIFEGLMANFAKRECHDTDIMPYRNIAGMALYLQQPPWESDVREPLNLLCKCFSQAKLKCPFCGTLFHFDQDNIRLLYEKGELACINNCENTNLHYQEKP